VAAADERQQVVLAHRIQLDVLHHDDLVDLRREQRAVDDLFDALRVAARQELHRFRGAHRRVAQPLAVRIFSQRLDQAAIVRCERSLSL
jgi:hypothetical protein